MSIGLFKTDLVEDSTPVPMENEYVVLSLSQENSVEIENQDAIIEQERSFTCEVCQKSFTTRKYLYRHKKIHSDDKFRFSCTICEKKLTKNSDLKRHMWTHTREKLYQCHICSKNFRQPGHLTSHIKIHLDIRAYSCPICQQTFVEKRSLKSHVMRKHTQEKQYQCKICEATFVHINSLKVHKLSHSKEKAFQCSICNASFGRITSFKIHERVHTKQKSYKCETCQRFFATSSSCRRHKMTHFRKKPGTMPIIIKVADSCAMETSIDVIPEEDPNNNPVESGVDSMVTAYNTTIPDFLNVLATRLLSIEHNGRNTNNELADLRKSLDSLKKCFEEMRSDIDKLKNNTKIIVIDNAGKL